MSDESAATPRSSFLSRACENCRVRKIRCDKTVPCSSCRILQVACQPALRTTEHRPRMVISNQYEKQLELIQERLQVIEESIKNIAHVATPPISSAGTDLTLSTVNTPSEISVQNAYVLPSASRPITADIALPPVSLAVALMKKAKVLPPCSLVNLCWRDISQIEKLCQRLYFPSEPIPVGSTTLLNGLLHFTIRDYLREDDSHFAGFDLVAFRDSTEQNFSLGLQSYETLTIPTLENIQALLLGANKAQEQSKLSLCWTYISAAHTMCQTLGLHRNSHLKGDPLLIAEAKRHAFWAFYTMDKNLSLNLGRASNFQDHDIDVNYFSLSQDNKQRPWDQVMIASIEFSRLQGQVYDRLYSASSSAMSLDERISTVEELATKLISLRDGLVGIDVSQAYYSETLVDMVAIADFIAFSVLTVICHAQSSSGDVTAISPKCIQFAKMSLQGHLKCFASFQSRPLSQKFDYVVSILLYPSFTPFIIVFIHAIATLDSNDLLLLKETVTSLEQLRDISRGADKLYTVCRAFLQAADVLTKSGQKLEGLYHHKDGSLVLPPVTSQDASENTTGLSWLEPNAELGSNSVDMSLFLCNWLGTNRPVMDMLNFEFMDHDHT